MSRVAKKAGVIGAFVRHSLSPALHGYWLRQYSIEGSYEALATTADELPLRIKSLAAEGYLGVNVTVPHKEAVVQFMDALDPVARTLEAVNLIRVLADGGLEGRNTDGFGFVENLRAGAPALDLNGTRALVLGAGGTTKAVVNALLAEGAKVAIANRTQEKAQAIAARLDGDVTVLPWAERNKVLGKIDLLVNTTSLGMKGQPPLEVDVGELPKEAVVTDCVYTPLETDLLKLARKRGLCAVDGLGMLIHQARPAFKAWFGVDPEVTPALKQHLIAVQKGFAQ